MKWNLVKGYVFVVLAGLFGLVATVLVLTNIKNECQLWFGQNMTGQTGVVMLASALAGVVLVYVVKLLIRGIRDLRRGHVQQKLQRLEQIDKEKKKQASSETPS